MVLKLRQVHDVKPICLEKDDTLSVKYTAQLASTETVLMTEVMEHEGMLNTIISANIIIDDEFRGIAVFIGDSITPEDCGIEIEDEEL
ncbi:MAG TPA: hypothetical protein ENH82_01315 [bacterium]|nr:hypothetical protein [bacterium]